MDRHTVASTGDFLESTEDQYLENNCVDDPVKLCDFQLLENRIMKTVDSVYQVLLLLTTHLHYVCVLFHVLWRMSWNWISSYECGSWRVIVVVVVAQNIRSNYGETLSFLIHLQSFTFPSKLQAAAQNVGHAEEWESDAQAIMDQLVCHYLVIACGFGEGAKSQSYLIMAALATTVP